MKTIVVIPTYDEKDNVKKMADAVLSTCSLIPDPSSLELLFVDDNSPDGTGAVVDGPIAPRAIVFDAADGFTLKKGAADAASVIRYFRRNPNWRVVDVQSSRLEMNVIWDSVFAGGEDLPSIRRRRLVMTLQRNGVTKFFTGEAAVFAKLGCDFAENPFDE